MSNSITAEVIIKTAFAAFESNLGIASAINRTLDNSFNGEPRIGAALKFDRPGICEVVDGPDITSSIKDYVDRPGTLTISSNKVVPLEFTESQLNWELGPFTEMVIKPSVASLAAAVDADVALFIKNNTANYVGTRGTTPTSVNTIWEATTYLDDEQAPPSDRFAFLRPATHVAMVNSLKGLFDQGVTERFRQGRLGRSGGLDFYTSTVLPTHTVGVTSGSTPVTNGANQGITGGYAETTSLITNGWTGSNTLKKGDIITIGTVGDANSPHAVHPLTKANLGYLRRFVVTADIADTSADLTAVIAPAIIAGGAMQNCNVRAGTGLAINVVGTTGQTSQENLVLQKNAVTMACPKLYTPKNMDMAATYNDAATGLSMRFTRGWDQKTSKYLSRLEVWYGIAENMRSWAARVVG